MNILPTAIAGVAVVETTPFCDHRGAFYRAFCEKELAPVMGGRRIAQINLSRTVDVGAVRGLHYQRAPHGEMKCVRCVRGRVWDVAVDLRAGSPTFLQWHAETLTPENARMLVVPEGCAHGFQVLEADSEILYLSTAFYTPEAEGGVHPQDPAVAVTWPLAVGTLSARDSAQPCLSGDFVGLADLLEG